MPLASARQAASFVAFYFAAIFAEKKLQQILLHF